MLLPMLSIYQEYVRNHHYCLQVSIELATNTYVLTLMYIVQIKKSVCDLIINICY